jgi:hypothetical protein
MCSAGGLMYRDEPLDDEAELRTLVGDGPIDALLTDGGPEAVAAALDALRLLQGWIDDSAAVVWLTGPQRRLAGLSPLAALAGGDLIGVEEAVKAYIGAQA